MACNNGVAKVQHYVPQFLLKKFGNGKKDQLYVFDKHSGRSFSTNVKNVACESRFYDFKINDVEATLEPKLSKLEGQTKPLFERMLDQDSVNVFNEKERSLICEFFAIQFTRTKNFREQLSSLQEMLGERLKEMSGSHEEIEDYIKKPTENELKMQMADLMMTAPLDYGSSFENKTWHLLSTTRKNPFYIGDNPIVLQNTMKPNSLGLAVDGIEIYFPISSTRALAMWCPTHKEKIISTAQLIENGNFTLLSNEEIETIKKMALAIKSRSVIEFSKNNVVNLNHLQVSYAERYVFSSTDDFALPKQMLLVYPPWQKGKRMIVM